MAEGAAQGTPDSGGQATSDSTPDAGGESKQITLTPAQLAERLARAKPADYDDLKAKAAKWDQAEAANKSELERAADARQQAEAERDAARAEALRYKVASKHGISDEDAELFLTGKDEETLTRQAERLTARDSDSKKTGTVVPREGQPPATGNTVDAQFARQLFTGG